MEEAPQADKIAEEKPVPGTGNQKNPIPAPVRDFLWNLTLIIAGSISIALSVKGILIPKEFLSGGIMGITLGINYLFPALSVSLLYFLINIPIFIAGWRMVSRRFFWYSILGAGTLTLLLEWVEVTLPIHDNILSAILAGIFTGVGAGMILRSRGSGGGLDILSVILMNRFSIRIGNTYLAFNSVILTVAAYLVSLDAALYTLIYMYVTSHMIEIVVTGLSRRKVALIISNQWREILQVILHKLNRGATVIHAEGGYSGRPERVLYTVVTIRELARLKHEIRAIDPDAFVVFYDTMEVMGFRIGNQPHW